PAHPDAHGLRIRRLRALAGPAKRPPPADRAGRLLGPGPRPEQVGLQPLFPLAHHRAGRPLPSHPAFLLRAEPMSQASFQPKRLRQELFAHPLFIAVLLLKLAASALFASSVLRVWFAPFVDYFVRSGFANPWGHFLGLQQPKAFPYPP